jgi:hypothetical protein
LADLNLSMGDSATQRAEHRRNHAAVSERLPCYSERCRCGQINMQRSTAGKALPQRPSISQLTRSGRYHQLSGDCAAQNSNTSFGTGRNPAVVSGRAKPFPQEFGGADIGRLPRETFESVDC